VFVDVSEMRVVCPLPCLTSPLLSASHSLSCYSICVTCFLHKTGNVKCRLCNMRIRGVQLYACVHVV